MNIAVSAWSFHESLYAGRLGQGDVPARVADLGLRHVELLEHFLFPRPPSLLARVLRRARRAAGAGPQSSPDYDRSLLNDLRAARLRAGTRLLCWDADTDLTRAEPDARRAELQHMATAIEAARFLGAPLVRVTTGGQEGEPGGLGRAVDTLRAIIPSAVGAGVKLAIENHFGLSADPQVLAEIVAAISSPHVGVCLDLGNWKPGGAAEGLRLLAPLAVHVHAKSHAFGADGEESSIDYGAGMAALRDAGYDQAISIEFEGAGDPVEGIARTRALIERHWNG